MHTSTADINPSEEDREIIHNVLQKAADNAHLKIEENEKLLKKHKNMDPDAQKETEHENIKLRRYSETIEDALNKCERTTGHTLKKAFNKKAMTAIKDSLGDPAQCATLEEVLHNNHLA